MGLKLFRHDLDRGKRCCRRTNLDSGRVVGKPYLNGSWKAASRRSPLDAPSSRLLPPELMLSKERPHLPGRVDASAIPPEHPFRCDPLAAGPLMAFSFDCVQHHARIVSTVGVLQARHIGSDRRCDGIRSAPVSPRPIRHKARNTRKCAAGELRPTAVV